MFQSSQYCLAQNNGSELEKMLARSSRKNTFFFSSKNFNIFFARQLFVGRMGKFFFLLNNEIENGGIEASLEIFGQRTGFFPNIREFISHGLNHSSLFLQPNIVPL